MMDLRWLFFLKTHTPIYIICIICHLFNWETTWIRYWNLLEPMCLLNWGLTWKMRQLCKSKLYIPMLTSSAFISTLSFSLLSHGTLFLSPLLLKLTNTPKISYDSSSFTGKAANERQSSLTRFMKVNWSLWFN